MGLFPPCEPGQAQPTEEETRASWEKALSFYRGKDYRSENVSNSGYDLLYEFQLAGLNIGLHSEHGVPLCFEEDGVHGTTIDYAWPMRQYAIFLDGPPHLKSEKRDELITEALEKRGWKVDRYPYKPPLSNLKKAEIVAAARKALDSSQMP